MPSKAIALVVSSTERNCCVHESRKMINTELYAHNVQCIHVRTKTPQLVQCRFLPHGKTLKHLATYVYIEVKCTQTSHYKFQMVHYCKSVKSVRIL